MPNLLTSGQACRIMNISYPTLSKLILSGEVAAIKVGRQWRIPEDKLVAKLQGSSMPHGASSHREVA
jgi:excisionase family DNA binding protein